MSVIVYNEVCLPYAYITGYNQEAVYDDSNTDRMYTKVDISAQCVVNAAYASILGVAGTSPAALMNNMREKLLTPRKKLEVSFNGTNIIPQSGRVTGADAKNGPLPQACNIIQLTNTTFLVLYRIIAHYGAGGANGGAALCNRWTESVDIDGANFTTRTREGKYVIRSDNVGGIQADDIRSNLAVVGVPEGFLRVSSNYTVSPDGLGISYRVTDREVFKMPPAPAFKARGQYIESTTNNGHVRWGECVLELEGSKNTIQADLLNTCINVVSSKLQLGGAQLNVQGGRLSFSILAYSTVKIDMYENNVECRMKARMAPRTAGSSQGRKFGMAGVDLGDFARTPFSDGLNITVPYKDRGSASFLLQAAAYFDPALKNSLNPQTGQMNNGNAPGTL